MSRLVCLSDTHEAGQRGRIGFIPEGDVLIHCGDLTYRGGEAELIAELEWFRKLPHRRKIMIAGNHDFKLEEVAFADRFRDLAMAYGVHYLDDSGVELDGIKYWGSPVQPTFHDWAFNRVRGAAIKQHWDWIPDDTDVLITHGPPVGILDRTLNGDLAGCSDLYDAVMRVKPQVHCFGHIHESYGVREVDGIWFYNCSIMNHQYEPVHEPWTSFVDNEEQEQPIEIVHNG